MRSSGFAILWRHDDLRCRFAMANGCAIPQGQEYELVQAHPGYYGEMVWIAMMLERRLQRRAPNWWLAT